MFRVDIDREFEGVGWEKHSVLSNRADECLKFLRAHDHEKSTVELTLFHMGNKLTCFTNKLDIYKILTNNGVD